MTNQSVHLTIDQFANLKVDPKSANDTELDHLVDCSICRDKIATVDHYFETSVLCINADPNKLPDVKSNPAEKHIWPKEESNQNSLLSHLFLQPSEKHQTDKIKDIADFRIKKNKNRTSTITLPMWSVAASLFLSVLVGFWISNTQDQEFIASYQDSAGILITQPALGIGFFEEKSHQRQSVKNVTLVKNRENTLIMEWPDFAKSNRYQIIITEENSNDIIDSVVSGLKLELSEDQFIENRNYQWLIKANNADDLIYELRGGFILKK